MTPSDDDSAIPNRYSEVCMSVCPAWFPCLDGEGMPHHCPACNKRFFVYTKPPVASKAIMYTEMGRVFLETWRLIEGIPLGCPFLKDYIQHPHWCSACMREHNLEPIEKKEE